MKMTEYNDMMSVRNKKRAVIEFLTAENVPPIEEPKQKWVNVYRDKVSPAPNNSRPHFLLAKSCLQLSGSLTV
jgi:hypothetical protein